MNSIEQLTVDLLHPSYELNQPRPIIITSQLAVCKFAEQTEKAGLTLSCYRSAYVKIEKLPILKTGSVNGYSCVGYDIRLSVSVVSNYGRSYESEISMFVAPHDPRVERRSG
ncbi:MAG: hypothetical protein ACYC27_00285 [Armatimonadota bacterium]